MYVHDGQPTIEPCGEKDESWRQHSPPSRYIHTCRWVCHHHQELPTYLHTYIPIRLRCRGWASAFKCLVAEMKALSLRTRSVGPHTHTYIHTHQHRIIISPSHTYLPTYPFNPNSSCSTWVCPEAAAATSGVWP